MIKWTIQHLPLCESTNIEAKSLSPYHVVIADKQTQGKGRNGRTWISDNGNLFMSVVLPIPQELSCYSLLAGLSVAQALPFLSTHIKWPNDILIDGKKVAGILLELTEDTLIIGIGVNILSKPKEKVLYPVTSLSEWGLTMPAFDFAKKILQNIKNNIQLLEKRGFSYLRQEWLDYASGVGDMITVNLPTQRIDGVFIGIDEAGALILKEQDGQTQTITAGDVFFTPKE